MDERIRWARKVSRAKINRLYQTDALGIVDEELIDDVGTALLARCESVIAVSRAQAVCPRCGAVFDVGWGRDANDSLACPTGCGWQMTAEDWHRSWRHQDLIGTRAAKAFEHYTAHYPQARTPQQRMLLIDGLIHAFHEGIIAGAPHRLAANNLIEGSYGQVQAFLDALSYGENSKSGLGGRQAEWQEKSRQADLARRPHTKGAGIMSASKALVRSAPEAQGIPSAAILAFIEGIEQHKLELHSLMLVRHGQVTAEGWWAPYAPDRPHMLYSLSKSFTSTAVGLAVAEGRLTVDDPVLAFFPEDAPRRPGVNLRAMRVRHLLSMSTGHDKDTTGFMHRASDGNWARAFLARPVTHQPGTHFLYNTGATYMLSAIVQKLTGQTLLDYLGPRLFEPLGIEGAAWESCPHGVNTGGYGLSIKTEDIAKFGQLYLRRGKWQGQQLAPAAWVAQASAKQVDNAPNPNPDWAQGYGYQFWRCRHDAYRGDGAFGQFCVVMPEQDAVLAITAGVGDMQAVLDLAWAHLLPAMGKYPLPEEIEVQAALERRLARLALPLPEGLRTSPIAAQISGQTYLFEPNRQGIASVRLDFDGPDAVITVSDGQREVPATCGYGSWRIGEASFGFPDGHPRAVAAAGAWMSDDTYTAQFRFCETPHCTTVTYRFAGDSLVQRAQQNVSFGPTKGPRLVGRRA